MRTSRQAGFSLVEVLCAILVLGVGLVGLTQGLSTALISSKEAELQTTAALLAAGQIETLRAEGYLGEGVSESQDADGQSIYKLKQSVTRTSTEGLYEVEVVVSLSKTGRTIYELRTLLFDPPVYSTLEEQTSRKDSRSAKRERRRR